MRPEQIEFDTPIETFGPDKGASLATSHPPVPESVELDGDDDYRDQINPWKAVRDRSGQHGYRGPLMHESEVVGGGMWDWMQENPALYVTVPVLDADGEDYAGWMLLIHDKIDPSPTPGPIDRGDILMPYLYASKEHANAGMLDFDNPEGETLFKGRIVRENDEYILEVTTFSDPLTIRITSAD